MALLQDVTLGIDFGTSNSAMSVRQGQGAARMISLEGDARTLGGMRLRSTWKARKAA